MPILQTIKVTKDDGTTFTSANDAIEAYRADKDKTNQDKLNSESKIKGGMIQNTSLIPNGYMFSRTWTDEKWQEKTASGVDELADNNMEPVSYTEEENGWTKKVDLSYVK
tara:strand:- start:2122 stop:2451 length:330 start_codon:yes stop_codon:yes gene_type:complete